MCVNVAFSPTFHQAWLQIINEISPRVKDNIVGLGEQMACKIMTAVLRDQVGRLWHYKASHLSCAQGIDAEYVSLDDVVPDILDLDGVNNETLDQTFFDQLTVAVGERIKECTPRVPVVTGQSTSAYMTRYMSLPTSSVQDFLVRSPAPYWIK